MSLVLGLAGRTAVVTGAGRGFGEQIARDLAALGAAVGVLDINAPAGERCAERLRAAGGRAIAAACDVADFDGVHAAFAEVAGALGPVDILVNNAGIVSFTDFLETTAEEFDRVFAVDYTGPYNCCKAVVPGMIERRYGRIVNVASVAGKRGGGFLGKSAYAAAKASINGLTKAIARELAPSGVRVNSVNPGLTDTPRLESLRADPDVWRRCLAAVPLGRVAAPAEIAAAIVFLLSDAAGYVTGETLNVDAGISME